MLKDERVGMKGVTFEDNLSSHKTDMVEQFWASELTEFAPPHFCPPNMTSVLQPIDRNVGVIYKGRVYKGYRRIMEERLSKAMAALNGSEHGGDLIQPLSPRDKRVLITKIIGDTHEELSKTDVFTRAFEATGTWMPVDHLFEQDGVRPSAVVVRIKEQNVKLQHFREYKYSEEVTSKKIYERIDELESERVVATAEAARLKAKRDAHLESERIETEPFVQKAQRLLSELETRMYGYVSHYLRVIHVATGYDSFVIGGSWASSMIAKVLSEWTHCSDLVDFDKLDLVANDIDLYHGHWSTEEGNLMTVDFQNGIKKFPVTELQPWELNTVKCHNLSASGFLPTMILTSQLLAFW